MTERIKWHRPKNDREFKIEPKIKDLLSYQVLFGCSKYVAVEKLCPEYNDTLGRITDKGRQVADQIFDHSENKRYVKAMRQTLSDLSNGVYESEEDGKLDDSEISEDKKRLTITRMLNQLVKLIGEGNLSGDELKTYSEIMKKVGWLKDDESALEAPRRYLPTQCKECLYCSCVESYVETGQMENACLRCKALDIAKEQGFCYDPTKLLKQD